ncbi:hypothetical protein PORY_000807 [Pneumocystis oryctolagi]|uniref:Uncharacterized protein n=1 Tax=Pneumocystis oryctolagi TaxID=42067 RepID=A0ACB7CDQ0_9ASCO|nr:hypothetical protein PORY_000807 [Pneumocystis oryctolagi]
MEKGLSLYLFKNLTSPFVLTLFFPFLKTIFAHKSESQQKYGIINRFIWKDINDTYLKNNTFYDSGCKDTSNNSIFPDEIYIYIYGTLEKPFSHEYFKNIYKQAEDDTLKMQYQSVQEYYVSPYIKKIANIYTYCSDIYFLYIMKKIKKTIDFRRFKKRNMVENEHSQLNLNNNSKVECVNFLKELEESNLNVKSKECFKNSAIYSGCPNIFDIPCLCSSNNYKSATAQCIYQKSIIQLFDAYFFSSSICSTYSSLPSSCISSFMNDSVSIYKKYGYQEKNNKTLTKSDGKNKAFDCKNANNDCPASISVLNNCSVLTFVFVTIGISVFIELGLFFLV